MPPNSSWETRPTAQDASEKYGEDCEAIEEGRPLIDRKEDDNINETTTSSHTRNFFKGILLSVISGMLFTTNNFIIKQFEVVPLDAVLVRGVVQVTSLFIFSTLKKYSILPDTRRLFLLTVTQAIFGGLSFIGALICVKYMPVADALVVMFSDPLATMLVASLMLGEKFNFLRFLVGFSIISGVAMVCRPPFLFPGFHTTSDPSDSVKAVLHEGYRVAHDQNYWIGVAFAVGAVLVGTFHNVIVPLCKEVKSIVLVLYVGLAAILISATASQLDPSARIATGKILEVDGKMWGILFGLAASGMLAYISLTRSLQLVSPTIVSSLRSLEIIFAFIVESLIFSTPPSLLSILGGLLVIAGVVAIAFEEKLLGCMTGWWRRRQYQAI